MMSIIKRKPRWFATTSLVAALIYFFVKVVLPSANTLTYGFAAYDTAARIVMQNPEDARLYDDEWFAGRTVTDTNGQARDIYNANPPTTALLFVPLVGFETPTTRLIWTSLNVLFLFAALALITRSVQLSIEASLFVSALVLISAPVAANFFFGQVYIFLLLLYALALSTITRRAEIAGVSLGLALILKTSGSPVWLLLVARRNWRVLAAGLTTVAAFTAISLPLVGLEAWQAYFTVALPRLLNAPSNSVTAYQTVNGFLGHLFSYNPGWNPQPLFDAPVLARVLTLGVGIAALAMSLWRTRALDLPHAFATLTILSVVLAPVAEEYHFVLLVIPLALLINDMALHPRVLHIALTGLALLLLAAPLPYKDARLNDGAAALLAYPRLYGAWMLWGILTFGRIPQQVAHSLVLKQTGLTAFAE